MRHGRSRHWLALPLAGAGMMACALVAGAQETEPAFSLPPLEEFSAIVERPLFSPDRRPPQTETAPDAAASGEDSGEEVERQVVLAGTATDQSARAVAILHDVSQGVQYRVWVGDQVQGWMVKAIKPRALVLATATQEVTITLDEPALPEAEAAR